MSGPSRCTWTRDGVLDWAERQEEPYEFDGTVPVAMGHVTFNQSLIAANALHALANAVRGTPWVALGRGMAVASGRSAVRFPDALVAMPPSTGKSRLMTPPAVVFEVISPSSAWLDRIVKMRE